MATQEREPTWCHDCGCYSFRDEWATSGVGLPNDTCPVCGDLWPFNGYGPKARWDDGYDVADDDERVPLNLDELFLYALTRHNVYG